MDSIVDELKKIIQETIGGTASNILIWKIYKALDEGATTPEALVQACIKTEKLVNLFIGADKAQIIGKQFREALARGGIKAA